MIVFEQSERVAGVEWNETTVNSEVAFWLK
jgi:hypothetical protein